MNFLLLHWRPLAAALTVVLVAVGSYALGRYGTPERVVVQEKVQIVEVERERVVVVEKEVEKKVYLQAESSRIHRESHEVDHPDGTKERHLTEDINVDRVVKDVEVRVVEVEVEKERVVEKEVEKRVLIEKTVPMPDWRVTALAGANAPALPGLLNGNRFDTLEHMAFGAQVERRIWGPVSAGAWGLTSGQVGLSLSLEF